MVGSVEGAGPIAFVWVFSCEGAGFWDVLDGVVVWCVWVRLGEEIGAGVSSGIWAEGVVLGLGEGGLRGKG